MTCKDKNPSMNLRFKKIAFGIICLYAVYILPYFHSNLFTGSFKILQSYEKSEAQSHYIPRPTQSPEILELHRRLNLTNPGQFGEAVILPSVLDADIVARLNESEIMYNFAEFVANLIPVDREIRDVRSEACKKLKYSENLPVASVIMVFYNESPVMILRTIYSILLQSPPHLIREIILVDDRSSHGKFDARQKLFLLHICFLKHVYSFLFLWVLSFNSIFIQEHLKKPLEDQIKQLPKTRIIRSTVRLGLMKARMLGAVNAKGPALIFMDSHMEGKKVQQV